MKLIRFIPALAIAWVVTIPGTVFAQSAQVSVVIDGPTAPGLFSSTVLNPNETTNINTAVILEPGIQYHMTIWAGVSSLFVAPGSAGFKAALHLTNSFDQPFSVIDQDHLQVVADFPDPSETVERTTNFTHFPFYPRSLVISKTASSSHSAASGSYSVNSNDYTLQFDGVLESDSSGMGTMNSAGVGYFTSDVLIAVSQETTLSLKGTMSAVGRGATQHYPTMPSGHARFDPWSGQWIDPPLADSFEFQMIGASLFTDILEFPTGIIATNKQFEVWVNHASIGSFSAGQGVNFVSLLGAGVTNFVVSGINPSVDGENPEAFPINLAYDTPRASFTMTPIPVPNLTIQMLNGSAAQLNWTTNASAYALESSGTLAQGPWTPVTNSPVVVGDQKTVTVGTAGGSRFYRLKKP